MRVKSKAELRQNLALINELSSNIYGTNKTYDGHLNYDELIWYTPEENLPCGFKQCLVVPDFLEPDSDVYYFSYYKQFDDLNLKENKENGFLIMDFDSCTMSRRTKVHRWAYLPRYNEIQQE